ncbi:hypothetical protein ACXIZN_04685 [Amycolatopsis sp. TRM77291]
MDVLTELEQRAWRVLTADPAAARSFYETILDDRIVVLLADRSPIQEREVALSALCGDKWDACRLDGLSATRISPAVGFVSYGMVATKDGTPYAAQVSSVYVSRDDSWKLRFHQHTRRW